MTDERTTEASEPQVSKPRSQEDIARELRLHPDRPRVVRLSRKAIGALAGVSGLAICGALIWALQTSETAPRQELIDTQSRQTAEGLTGLPDGYDDIPQLGPPLPGDLGGPMLEAGIEPPPVGTAEPADPEAQRREQERLRIEQEREAARASRLFSAETQTTQAAIAPVSSSPAATPLPQPITQSGEQSSRAPSRTERQRGFLNVDSAQSAASVERLQTPVSPNIIQAGSVIAAALITGLRSDLPGQVTAHVTENVYDSPTGRILLIPQGARLIGEYESDVDFGQRRALLAWTRLILPDGRSIMLERQPVADPSGYAGIEDRIDNHWGGVFRAAFISTLLSVGSEAGSDSEESALIRALRRGGSESIGQTGRQIVDRALDVPPTLTIRPGFAVRVIVTRDLVLEPWRS